MPSITYFLRFELRDPRPGIPYEEQEFTGLADAWESFRLFAEPDSAEVYRMIELAEHDWESGEERQIAAMTFSERWG